VRGRLCRGTLNNNKLLLNNRPMQNTTWLAGPQRGRPRPGRAKVRRLLLEQLRQAIATEPAALEADHLPADSLTNIRGRVSIMIGTIVVRLNREGFTQSDRLYSMRDSLALGRPVEPDDVEWLAATIAEEGVAARARGESPGR
jgi:hypothetical protein